ncbi:MAG TPA: hypothetical protein V6C97_16255 [Oculatellaceae cyanobacterium]
MKFALSWSKMPDEIKYLEITAISITAICIVVGMSGILGFIPYLDGFNFLGGLFAGIFGIFVGFSLDRVNDREKDIQTRTDFINLIHEELSDIKNKVYPQTKETYILYTDVWDSAVSSGVIRLFTTEQVRTLSKVYKSIKGTSYEAEWIRRDYEELESLPINSSAKAPVALKCIQNRDRHGQRMEGLSKEIDEVLKKNWWKVANN